VKRQEPFLALAQRVHSIRGLILAQACEVTHDVEPGILAAVESALLSGETHYTVRPGIPELRRRIAQAIVRAGGPRPDAEDPIDNVLITSSEAEALFVILLSFGLDSGDVLVSARAQCRRTPLFHLMGLRVDEAARPRLVYREWDSDREKQRKLLAVAGAKDLPDVLDLDHDLTCLEKSPPFDPDRTLLIGNLHSISSLSTFRVAYIMGPKALITRCRPWKQALSICSAAPSQRAALHALAGEETL
jgi:aspartate/methionine/tyrosine aminotransferase